MLPSFCPYINMRDAEPIRFGSLNPSSPTNFAMIPVLGDKNKIIIPDITTTEIKCGR